MQAWIKEGRATLSLAVPLIITNLAQVAIGLTDTLMMGWMGAAPLAAGTLAFNVYLGFMILGLGLITAVSPLYAIALGQGQHVVRQCARTTAQGFWLCGLYCLPAWAIMGQARSLLPWLGQDAVLSAMAAEYLDTLQWGLLPSLGIVVLRSFLAAHDQAGRVMIASWIAVLVHVGSNWLLMFGHGGFPALGLAGAGLSSTLSHACLFLILLLMIRRNRRFHRYRLLSRLLRPDLERLRELLRLGIPMGLAMLFEVSGFNVAAFMIGTLSADALAAHAVVLQVSTASFMVPLAIGQAATIRVGMAYGAQSMPDIRRAGWCAFGLGIGFMALCGGIFAAFPATIAHWFLDPADPANQVPLAIIAQLFVIVALFQVFDGTQVVGTGIFRGIKDTLAPMLFAALGYWGIAIPLGAGLAFYGGYGAAGIWSGLAIGLCTVALLMLGRWRSLLRQGPSWDRPGDG